MRTCVGHWTLYAGFARPPFRCQSVPCMHHRALGRLQQTATLSLAGFSSFTHLLQTAAGQAWTRRVSALHTTSIRASKERIYQGSSRNCDRPVRKSGSAPENIRKHDHGVRFSRPDPNGKYFHAKDKNLTTSTYTIDNTQHSTSTNSSSSSQGIDGPRPLLSPNLITNRNGLQTGTGDPWLDLVNSQSRKCTLPTPNNTSLTPPKNPYLLPSPTSRQMLLDNLHLALSFNPPPNPPTLVDYHESYPQYQSTISYNLLIELAIRHTHFGTAQWLFDAMLRAGIVRDKWTRRLLVRWLTRTGRWEQAWTEATGLTPEEALDKPLRRGLAPVITKIPRDMWEELLYTFARSALRRPKDIRGSIYEDRRDVLSPPLEIIKDPAPGTEASLRRQRLLARVQPIIEQNGWIGPGLMKSYVYPIVRGGRTAAAVEIVKTYFSSLPVELSEKDVALCLDIIHLLLSADTRNGLFSLYANEKLLQSLLRMHPSLKPSPKTLCLLLSPLKRAKKSGTFAFEIFMAFLESWGPEIVDLNVQRRIVNLAKKERRMDIVQAMLCTDTWETRDWPGNIDNVSSGPCRPPDKESYAHTKGRNGLENMQTA